jgi:hypothetical protein
MKALAGECQAQGGAWVAWFVMETNHSARRFYEKLGEPQTGEIAFVMEVRRGA